MMKKMLAEAVASVSKGVGGQRDDIRLNSALFTFFTYPFLNVSFDLTRGCMKMWLKLVKIAQ